MCHEWKLRTDASADKSFIIVEIGRQIQNMRHRRGQKGKWSGYRKGYKRDKTESKSEDENRIKTMPQKHGTSGGRFQNTAT